MLIGVPELIFTLKMAGTQCRAERRAIHHIERQRITGPHWDEFFPPTTTLTREDLAEALDPAAFQARRHDLLDPVEKALNLRTLLGVNALTVFAAAGVQRRGARGRLC
ncbi:hypothetical protein [Sphaerotilus montanus]|uniref:hypothetical protein n=1 Tax=Sphaerotilus montanus TaxID=522889 RepID=UPI001C5CB47D|nr:hypothetical protein [Sphaerotilus montanus]